jgi:hypothetical protein
MSEEDVTTLEALKTMGCNCAVMAGVSFVVAIITCAVVGICPDEGAFIPIAMVAIGGGIAVGGLVTCFGGDVREI